MAGTITAYKGPDVRTAKQAFKQYRQFSKNGYGNIAGESVFCFCNDQIIEEYISPQDQEMTNTSHWICETCGFEDTRMCNGDVAWCSECGDTEGLKETEYNEQ